MKSPHHRIWSHVVSCSISDFLFGCLYCFCENGLRWTSVTTRDYTECTRKPQVAWFFCANCMLNDLLGVVVRIDLIHRVYKKTSGCMIFYANCMLNDLLGVVVRIDLIIHEINSQEYVFLLYLWNILLSKKSALWYFTEVVYHKVSYHAMLQWEITNCLNCNIVICMWL